MPSSPASDPLRTRVASISVAEAGDALVVLPSTSAVLGIQLRGRVATGGDWLAPLGVTGILETARRFEYEPATTSLLVRFTPQGSGSLGVPADELTARSLALEDLIPVREARELRERVLLAADTRAAIETLAAFLLRRSFVPDALVDRAAAALTADAPDSSALVWRVARTLRISERQLERRFLERIGITPRRFARLRRFERAVARLERGTLTDAALEAGFYDQSHFIREFRAFAGTTPGAWRRSVRAVRSPSRR